MKLKTEQQHDHMKNLLRNLEVQKDEVEKDRQHLTKKLKATRERVERVTNCIQTKKC